MNLSEEQKTLIIFGLITVAVVLALAFEKYVTTPARIELEAVSKGYGEFDSNGRFKWKK